MSEGEGADARRLVAVDDLARRLVERAAPIIFAEVCNDAERDSAYRLRREVVADEGWVPADPSGDSLDRDEYDDRAIQIIAWDGDVTAGTVSVILPEQGRSLPVEESYGLVVEPEGRVVGAGRLIVARPYRDKEHRVLGGLAALTWQVMRNHGYRWAAGTATTAMLDLFRQLGFEVTVLGEARIYWGEPRFPIRMGAPDPQTWPQSWAAGRSGRMSQPT